MEETCLLPGRGRRRWRISVEFVLRAYANGALFGESFGSERARLLVLHGWRHDHHDFDQLLSRCSGLGISSLALDLPGFGDSPPPKIAWGTIEYAKCVLSVLDEMAPNPVILGHSFGGRIALQIAATYPDRIEGLILTGVPLVTVQGKPRSRMPYRMIRKLAELGLVSDSRLEQARQRYGSEDYRSANGVMREVLVRTVNEHYDEIVPNVKAHVEMVWGEFDTVVPIAVAKEALKLFPNASLTTAVGIGHMTPTDAVDDLALAVKRLLT